jgi:hypothetical protein
MAVDLHKTDAYNAAMPQPLDIGPAEQVRRAVK